MIIFDGQHQPRERQIWKALANTHAQFLIPDNSRIRIWLPENKIVIKESFKTRKHVEAYGEKKDDFFSDDYLFFEKMVILASLILPSKGVTTLTKGFPAEL